MPSRLFAKFSLKVLLVLGLLFVGLLPLFCSIVVNLPHVSHKLEQLTELERVHELEERAAFLEKVIEHRTANLRTITALPGARGLFSDPNGRFLDPKIIKKRMGAMFRHWLPPDTGVQAIVMINEAGEVVGSWGGMARIFCGRMPWPISQGLTFWLAGWRKAKPAL